MMVHFHSNVSIDYAVIVGWAVSEEELEAVATHSGVFEVETDFLDEEFRAEC